MATRHLSLAAPLAMLRYWMLLYMALNTLQQPRAVQAVAVDVDVNGPAAPPYDLDSIINQLLYPNPVYQLHASALRNQLRNMLRERQLATAVEESDDVSNALAPDYDYLDEDKRSVAALAAQGMLHPKRSLATLAKNGQLPSLPDQAEIEPTVQNESKRYVGSLARSGGFATYGKRNIGTLARDYQLPQNGKRNLATLARLGLLTKGDGNKRNVAAVARYNSHGRQATIAPTEKRNIGALKASPVHGAQQKRDEDEVYLPASFFGGEMDYVDMMPNYWLYPSYADLDWGDFGRAQKRFLDTSKDAELFGIENAPPPDEPDFLPLIGGIDPGDDVTKHDHFWEHDAATAGGPYGPPQQKRHIGSVYRSGFFPSYRALRSTTGSYGGYGSGRGGGRFSRSGRARQFVEYYPPHERLRQPIAAVCKRCFLPYRPVVHWGGAAGIRGRLNNKNYATYTDTDADAATSSSSSSSSILTNALPTAINRPPIAYASTANHIYHSSNKNNHKPINSRYSNNKSAYRARARSAAASPAAVVSSGVGRQNSHWGTPPRITALHRRSFRRPYTNSKENDAN